MNVLRLRFASPQAPELVMVEFQNSAGMVFRSVRGKTSGAHGETCTFQWTSAVKSLAVLGLRAALKGIHRAVISGEDKSVASALDYALSKPPSWLGEMFGTDSNGEPRAKRLFRRTNPERKRPGPVLISFNPSQFEQAGIEISMGRTPLKSKLEIQQLYNSLLTASGIHPSALGPECSNDPEELSAENEEASLGDPEGEFLLNIFERELHDSLLSVRVWSKQWTKERVHQLAADPLFRKLHSACPESLSKLAEAGPSVHRLGIFDQMSVRQAFCDHGPIRVYGSAVGAGYLGLWRFLRDTYELPIDIRYYYPYGTDLVESARPLHDDTVATVLCTGLGPTAEFFHNSHAGFSPFMFGPSMTHRLVQSAAQTKDRVKSEEILFVHDNPTSAMFCYDALVRQGILKKNALHVRHCEPEDTISLLLNDPSAQSIMWFPHYHMLERYMGASIVGDGSNRAYDQVTVILGNRALQQNPVLMQAVQLLLRDAWLRLMEEPNSRKQVARHMLADKQYVRFVKRCSGLHSLSH